MINRIWLYETAIRSGKYVNFRPILNFYLFKLLTKFQDL